jgi:hypothetical protein
MLPAVIRSNWASLKDLISADAGIAHIKAAMLKAINAFFMIHLLISGQF